MEIMAEQFPGAFSGYSLQVSFSLNLGIFLGGEEGGSSSFNSLILISYLLMVISSYHSKEYSTQLSHTSKYRIIVLIKNKYKTIMVLQLPLIWWIQNSLYQTTRCEIYLLVWVWESASPKFRVRLLTNRLLKTLQTQESYVQLGGIKGSYFNLFFSLMF